MNRTAFLSFHLRVGARLALSRATPIMAVFLMSYFVLKPEWLGALFSVLISRGSLLPGLLYMGICLAAAGSASARVSAGLTGWMRHLPLSGKWTRRLAEIAVFTAQIPVLLVLAVPVLLAMAENGTSPVLPAFLTGIPLLGIAAAGIMVPSRHGWAAALPALAAGLMFSSGRWILLPAGLALLAASDAAAGPLAARRKRRSGRRRGRSRSLPARIMWRAMKLRPLAAYLPALPAVLSARLLISHNSFPPGLDTRIMTWGGLTGLTLCLSVSATILAARRPPWPWIRSQPWSARQRILIDSLGLALTAVPLLAAMAFFSWKAGLSAAAALPALSLYSAAAMRTGGDSKTGAAGGILKAGIPLSLAVGISPVSVLLLLPLLPFLLRYAARRERDLPVSRWQELHHLAAGDSLSWSRS